MSAVPGELFHCCSHDGRPQRNRRTFCCSRGDEAIILPVCRILGYRVACISQCPLCVASGKVCCGTGAVECAQLASRISAVVKSSADAGEDPFSRGIDHLITDVITDLINKSRSEVSSAANDKPYRDDELVNTVRRKLSKKIKWRRTLPSLKQLFTVQRLEP